MPYFVLWGDLETPYLTALHQIPVRNVVAAKQAFTSHEEAEDGIRQITEAANAVGQPIPQFQIVEATIIEEATSKARAPGNS